VTAPPATKPGLSAPQGTALTIGALLGTGVMSLPALAVQKAGPASLLAWGLLLVVSIPLAATFAALGARHPGGGGVTTYAQLAFGSRISTMLGWAFFLTIPLGAPAAAGFGGAYVSNALGQGQRTTWLVTALIILLVAGLNWPGLRINATVQLAIVATLAAILAVTAIVSLPHSHTGDLHPFAPHGVSGIAGAVAVLIWAFAGWEVVASLSGEYADPVRDLRRSATAALAIVGVLYLAIAFATVLVLGSHPGNAPLSDLLVLGLGDAARPVMTVVAVLLTVGTMNVYFAGASRLGETLGRAGVAPRWLQQDGEPRRAMVLITLLGLAVVGFDVVADEPTSSTLTVATGTFALAYVVATGAAVKLLPRGSWAWIAAVVSLVASIGLVIAVGWPVLVTIAVGLAGLLWNARRRPAAA